MSFYSEMQGVASDVLKEFDQSRGTGTRDDGLWYVESKAGTGPADEPGAPTLTYHKLDGTSRGVSQEYVDDALILKGDLQGTFAVIPGVAIKAPGYITADGRRYSIVRVDRIPETGEPVAYRVFFRKG